MSAHRRASRLAGIVMPASRGTSSKSPRFIRHRRRFGDFPAEGNAPHLALPLGELSPKVTERACRGGRPCPPKPAGLTLPAEGSGPYEMSADRTLVGRGPCLPTVVPADSRPLSRPTAGALPRNRLASSATDGASAISPKFPLPAQKGRADRWPVRPQVRRKMVRKKQYYSSMASSHTAPMAAPPNRAASHGDIRSRRRGGAPWVRA